MLAPVADKTSQVPDALPTSCEYILCISCEYILFMELLLEGGVYIVGIYLNSSDISLFICNLLLERIGVRMWLVLHLSSLLLLCIIEILFQ
jgi:hypothetical protein